MNNIEVGVSSASYFSKLQTEDAVLDIGMHHVPVCELFLNSFSEYQPDYVELLAHRVQESGVRVFSVHPMSTQFEPMLFSIHPRQSGDAWKLYEQVLCAAKKLGAHHYVMHGAANLSGAAKNLQMERIAPILKDLIDLAETYDVTLTLENVSWCIFNEPDFGLRLQDALQDHRLKHTLDIKQAIRAGHTPLEFIEAVGDDIVNLHLCDAVTFPNGRYQLKMPGEGQVDYGAIGQALVRHGYHGPAFLEVYSDMYDLPEQLYASYEKMRAVFACF